MNQLKVIIYCSDLRKYGNFIQECEMTFESTVLVFSSVNFFKELLYAEDVLTVIFIEDELNDSLNDSVLEIITHKNYYCVAFSDQSVLDKVYYKHINDYLECREEHKTKNFFKRLIDNLSYKGILISDFETVNSFYRIAKQITVEKDLTVLMNLILEHSMRITKADAGTLFMIVDRKSDDHTYYEKNSRDNLLKFMIAKNKTIQTDLVSTTMDITEASIIGASVITGSPIRINDVYDIEEVKNYTFDKSFDHKTGYRTQSILTIPMKNYENRVIGVIQLINKTVDHKITFFSQLDETLISSLTGLGAVVIDNSILYRDLTLLNEINRNKVIDEINKRKNADEEINKLLSAVELSPMGVMITDINGSIKYVNPKFELLTGYSYSEAIGQNPRILKSDLYNDNYYSELWSTILEGEEWHGELYEKKKNGTHFWANCHIAPVKSKDNTIKYFVAIQEDITGKKLLMTEIEEKNRVLEETIVKLNQSQMQVIQSEKMAGIGQLAAGVAHEINNPLAFVTSNFKSLKEYMHDMIKITSNKLGIDLENPKEIISDEITTIIEDISEILDESEEGLERVSDIIKALRVFSTIDENDEYQSYDLNMNIENTLMLLENELNDVVVKKDLNKIPLVKVISKEINQVILNLLRNALYAVKDGMAPSHQGEIIIKTSLDEHCVILEIVDNGCGIEDEIINRIFDPFFTTKPIGIGTGLGLGIVYDVITKKHHGKINCSSQVGVGTTFTIALPYNIEQ